MKYAPLVEYCVKGLVDMADVVEVEEVEDGDALQVRIKVAPDDTGKVIGRNGRLVGALRQVVAAAATKNGDQVYVKVITD
jgi:predicted RNA-binding protein YlqC (UPF0109 family)